MQLSREGLELIKRFEGLRTTAYRCPSGVWTIGYGHTAAAGEPRVDARMTITSGEADEILARDVAAFAHGVAAALKVNLPQPQFSALVSFAYNVGLDNFRGSSVLKAVNGGDTAAVPRRLLLWNRAGGRVLPGLTRRRAAEAELFLSGADPRLPPVASGEVAASQGKPLSHSSTALAAIVAALSGLATLAAGGRWYWQAGLGLAVVAAALWILRERKLKSKLEGI